MFISKKYRWTVWVAAAYIFWYALFEWNSIDYPNYAKGPCYSPNHAYYITRHQTLAESIHLLTPHDYGTARLFDRSGKLLYEKETLIDGEGGPQWYGGFKNDPMNKPTVFFQGTENPGWTFDLPEYPGKSVSNRKCYPVKTE